MQSEPRFRNAFTLIEILIVVIILGILAAISVPQFARAGDDTVKSSIRSQVHTITTTIEVYRGQNYGLFPTDDLDDPMAEGGSNSGWGVLVSADYLKEAPLNPYTNQVTLAAGDLATAIAETRISANGWLFEIAGGSMDVHAAGYDPATDLLEHEF